MDAYLTLFPSLGRMDAYLIPSPSLGRVGAYLIPSPSLTPPSLPKMDYRF